jgi:uncharacterized damage-inducible protein DinB
MNERSLPEQLLQAWFINNSITIKLIRAIPVRGFSAVPPASRGRSVRQQLMHMNKVHAGWLRLYGVKLPSGARWFKRDDAPTRAQLVAAFRASGKAVGDFLRERFASGRRITFFQGKPVRWMCYVIAHDSHHRGQIALALKQNGMRLPEQVAIRDLWYSWYGGNP